jgi:hypothetical protein
VAIGFAALAAGAGTVRFNLAGNTSGATLPGAESEASIRFGSATAGAESGSELSLEFSGGVGNTKKEPPRGVSAVGPGRSDAECWVERKFSSEPCAGGTLPAPTPAVLVSAVPVGAVLAGAAIPLRIGNGWSAPFRGIAGAGAGADRKDAAGRGFAGAAAGFWVSEAIAGATGCSRSTAPVESKFSSRPRSGGTVLTSTPAGLVGAVLLGAVIVCAVLPLRITNEGGISFCGTVGAGWVECTAEKAGADVVAEAAPASAEAGGQ